MRRQTGYNRVDYDAEIIKHIYSYVMRNLSIEVLTKRWYL